MKLSRSIVRILTGLLFIFSGVAKGIDPLGSAYKFHDYFHAFNIEFLQGLSTPLSFLLFSAEFITGFLLLTGIRQKTGTWAALLLMLIFTPLTFVLALTNPVSDCGCFGDAVHLTNWQTFLKNLVLLAMVLFLFLSRKSIPAIFSGMKEWIITASATLVIIIFGIINLKYLPVIDFLPYKVGVNIREGMTIPEDAPGDKYKTTFIYEKDGIKKEFTLDNYPADDTTWHFVDQVSILLEKGYTPPIHDFLLTTLDNENITEAVLNNNGYTLLMISKKLSQASARDLELGFQKGINCITNDIDFYVLTASGSDEIRDYDNGLEFCMTDETTLKTIVRSNPGFMLIKNGIIIGKWSMASLPDDSWFSGNIEAKQLLKSFRHKGLLLLLVSGLAFSILIILIIYRNKNSLNNTK